MITDAALAKAVAGFTPVQVEKALALIAEDRIRGTEFPGEFVTVSSDGHTHYITAADACQCPKARSGHGLTPCYHQAAVRLFTAGKAA